MPAPPLKWISIQGYRAAPELEFEPGPLMALVGEADHLVSGDHCAGLIQRGDFSRKRIVTPGMFSLKPFEAGACSSVRLTVSSGANPSFRAINAARSVKFRHTAINFVATYLRLLV